MADASTKAVSKRLPVFHIGANKAGSTTLQRALFDCHPEVLSLGKHSLNADAQQAVGAALAACDRLTCNVPAIDPKSIHRLWSQALASNAAGGRVAVFSREEMIRQRYYDEPDPVRLPKAIVAMAGPVRVVIITRHQIKLIESLYIHKANSSNMLPPDKWFASLPEQFAFGYRFNEIADAWAQVVGEENVGVFLFEELAGDTESFARRLCNFIGIDTGAGAKLLAKRHENVRKSERTQIYARLRSSVLPRVALGKLLPSPLRRTWRTYLDRGRLARVELPADWLRRIDEHYRPDNRRLAKRFGLPLEKYHYPL